MLLYFCNRFTLSLSLSVNKHPITNLTYFKQKTYLFRDLSVNITSLNTKTSISFKLTNIYRLCQCFLNERPVLTAPPLYPVGVTVWQSTLQWKLLTLLTLSYGTRLINEMNWGHNL